MQVKINRGGAEDAECSLEKSLRSLCFSRFNRTGWAIINKERNEHTF